MLFSIIWKMAPIMITRKWKQNDFILINTILTSIDGVSESNDTDFKYLNIQSTELFEFIYLLVELDSGWLMNMQVFALKFLTESHTWIFKRLNL